MLNSWPLWDRRWASANLRHRERAGVADAGEPRGQESVRVARPSAAQPDPEGAAAAGPTPALPPPDGAGSARCHGNHAGTRRGSASGRGWRRHLWWVEEWREFVPIKAYKRWREFESWMTEKETKSVFRCFVVGVSYWLVCVQQCVLFTVWMSVLPRYWAIISVSAKTTNTSQFGVLGLHTSHSTQVTMCPSLLAQACYWCPSHGDQGEAILPS